MSKWFMIGILALPLLGGCAAGSATAGYALKAQAADDLTAGARKAIVDEAVSKSKDYADSTFVKKV